MEVVFAGTDGGPYHRRLKSKLEERGVTVSETDGLNLGIIKELSISNDSVLHLHFVHWFYSDESLAAFFISILKLWTKLLFLRISGCRIVWTVHDFYSVGAQYQFLHQLGNSGIIIISHHVIIHCKSGKELVREEFRLPTFLASQFVIIPHGNFIDTYPNNWSRSEARDELGISNDKTVFLSLGALKPYKNIPDLIRSFQRLDNSDVYLLIAGNDLFSEVGEEITRLATDDSSIGTRLERIPEEEIGKYMAASNVAVYPYDKRLTSGAIMMATSLGVPVIASDVGCVQSMVSEEGSILYNPDNKDCLFFALKCCLTTELDGKLNYKKAKRANWDIIAEKTMMVYGFKQRVR